MRDVRRSGTASARRDDAGGERKRRIGRCKSADAGSAGLGWDDFSLVTGRFSFGGNGLARVNAQEWRTQGRPPCGGRIFHFSLVMDDLSLGEMWMRTEERARAADAGVGVAP